MIRYFIKILGFILFIIVKNFNINIFQKDFSKYIYILIKLNPIADLKYLSKKSYPICSKPIYLK